MTDANHAYPKRPLHVLMAAVIEHDPIDLDLLEDTLTLLARLRDDSTDRGDQRYIQGLLSRLMSARAAFTGEGIILRG